MKEWEIWIEGYAATGEHSTASFEGNAFGETFDEACENFTYPEDYRNPYYGERGHTGPEYFYRKGDHLKLDKSEDGTFRRGSYRGDSEPGIDRAKLKGNYSIWCCQLFPTEAEARKSFG